MRRVEIKVVYLETYKASISAYGGIFATMKTVLDTNILGAVSRSNRGASYRLLQLIPDERFQICLSMPLYLEYLDVLTRPEHQPKEVSIQHMTGAVR